MLLRPAAFVVFLVLATGLTGRAQSVGDAPSAVESALGRPPMVRTTAAGEVWIYSSGARVTFRNGVVSAIEGLGEDGVERGARETVNVVREPAPASAPRSLDQREGVESRGWSNWGDPIGVVLFIVCAGVALVAQIVLLFRAFKQGLLWGLGCAFVPCITLIYVVCHWSDARGPFLLNLAAVAAMFGIMFGTGFLAPI